MPLQPNLLVRNCPPKRENSKPLQPGGYQIDYSLHNKLGYADMRIASGEFVFGIV